MSVDTPEKDAFTECANCGNLVDLSESHPRVMVRHETTANDSQTDELHFCSEDCLDVWTGPYPE